MDPIKLFKHKSRVEAKLYIKTETCKFAVKLAETSVMYFILSFAASEESDCFATLKQKVQGSVCSYYIEYYDCKGLCLAW